MQRVYIELVFLDNFIINMLILLLASLLTKSKKRWRRFAVSAGIGGAYACAVFGTSGLAVSLPAKIAVSALMCAVAYHSKSDKGFWKNVCAFYITSFVFAGAIYAVSFSLGGSAVSGGSLVIRPLARYILIGLGVGAVIMAIFSRVRRRTIEREQRAVELELRCGERHTGAKAYIDTGNMLTEPLSGLSVVFITAAAAGKLFDSETISVISCRTGAATERLRIVPCATASGTSIFYGMEIDGIALKGYSEGIKAVICIAKGTLAYGCDAVIGSGIMDELTKGAGYDKVSGTEDSGLDTGTIGDRRERGLHQRKRGFAASADAAGGSVAADTAGQRRQVC